jgi:uncharacterized membrane protein YedE/YeeE
VTVETPTQAVAGGGALGDFPGASGPDRRVLALALVLLFGGAAAVAGAASGHHAGLFLLGAALGLVLYHAAFGFASGWRAFVAEGRGANLRAQMLMLAVASAIFLPVLDVGSLFGRGVGGAVAPAGVSVLVGAFLFGIGMQLGGGCASGTLYAVGGGSGRMVVTLVFFMAGSLLGTAQMPWWLSETPKLPAISLLEEWGLAGALSAQMAAFALIALATVAIERRRHGRLDHGPRDGRRGVRRVGWSRLLQGPWPLLWGAVLLALLNAATLGLAGHPWTISFGYTVWGAKAATAIGVDVASWEFWTWAYPKQALADGILAQSTSVMNLGIIAGAFLAAGLAGSFGPVRNLSRRGALAAALGGLLMGYGARLAYGCNIGAYFSGIASGSLHGWVWLVAALLGTYVGLAFRPAFGFAGGLGKARS